MYVKVRYKPTQIKCIDFVRANERISRQRDKERNNNTTHKQQKNTIFKDVTFKVKYEQQSQRQKQHQFDLLSLSEWKTKKNETVQHVA